MHTEDYVYLHELEERFWWFVGMRAITSALLDPFCLPASDRMILDVGCGTGGNLIWLARYAGTGRVLGIDREETALHLCRSNDIQLLAQASATALPYAEESFDLVTSFDVLCQIPGAGEDDRAIDEMYRVLKPGGTAFVRVPAHEWMQSGHDAALNTQRRYTLSSMQQKLERTGFTVMRATYANAALLPIAMLRRLLLKRVGLADSGSDVKPLPPKLQWLNRLLTKALTIEASILRNSNARFPTGLSAICIARKQ